MSDSSTTAPAGRAGQTVVLVHGAFADASGWAGVISLLEAAGVAVVAPPNPLRGLSADTAYIASAVNQVPGPDVLVGLLRRRGGDQCRVAGLVAPPTEQPCLGAQRLVERDLVPRFEVRAPELDEPAAELEALRTVRVLDHPVQRDVPWTAELGGGAKELRRYLAGTSLTRLWRTGGPEWRWGQGPSRPSDTD